MTRSLSFALHITASVAGVAILCVLSAGCKHTPDSPVVARVGTAVFTLHDLDESVPVEYRGRLTREEHISYVRQWIDKELLYQEALRQGINREKALRARVQKMQRDLLGAEILTRNSLSLQNRQIPEDAINEFYVQNRDTFVRDRDVVRYAEIAVPDIKTARIARAAANPANFPEVAARFSTAPLRDSVGYVALESLSREMAAAVIRTPVNGISEPIPAAHGYSIVFVTDKQPAGSALSLEEVRGEVINTLSSRVQKAEMERILAELRQKSTVEFDFGVIPQQAADGQGGVGE